MRCWVTESRAEPPAWLGVVYAHVGRANHTPAAKSKVQVCTIFVLKTNASHQHL